MDSATGQALFALLTDVVKSDDGLQHMPQMPSHIDYNSAPHFRLTSDPHDFPFPFLQPTNPKTGWSLILCAHTRLDGVDQDTCGQRW